jgi:hypothetical protein
MNEQVQKLAEQAELNATLLFNKDKLEKFAALIITECIDIVKPTGHHEVWAQSYLGGVDGLDLLYSKIKDIKRHFGVEE